MSVAYFLDVGAGVAAGLELGAIAEFPTGVIVRVVGDFVVEPSGAVVVAPTGISAPGVSGQLVFAERSISVNSPSVRFPSGKIHVGYR